VSLKVNLLRELLITLVTVKRFFPSVNFFMAKAVFFKSKALAADLANFRGKFCGVLNKMSSLMLSTPMTSRENFTTMGTKEFFHGDMMMREVSRRSCKGFPTDMTLIWVYSVMDNFCVVEHGGARLENLLTN